MTHPCTKYATITYEMISTKHKMSIKKTYKTSYGKQFEQNI